MDVYEIIGNTINNNYTIDIIVYANLFVNMECFSVNIAICGNYVMIVAGLLGLRKYPAWSY